MLPTLQWLVFFIIFISALVSCLYPITVQAHSLENTSQLSVHSLLVDVGESVNERKKGDVALNITIEPLRTRSGWEAALGCEPCTYQQFDTNGLGRSF